MVVVSSVVWLFLFFKQKTAYEMRISDWSSDVCSSDLRRLVRLQRHQALVLVDGVADRDQHFDHGHVVVAADVGNLDFLSRHVVTPRGAGRAPGRPWLSGVGPLLLRPGVESLRLRR